MATYQELRGKIKTGDIILFSGKGGISAGIKWFTGSKWSHVGMALRLPEWDAVLLWESTTLSDIKDIESGEERKGVQIVPLSERLRKYKGGATIRFLSVDRTPTMLAALSSLRAEVKERPYEKDKIELIKAAYDGPFGKNDEDLSSLFCSELVAEAYQRMDLLNEDKPSNEYTPKDFSDEAGLELLKGNLGEEIPITG
jgi:hypothetical protein